MGKDKKRARASLWDRFDAWAASDAARELIRYQQGDRLPSYIQQAKGTPSYFQNPGRGRRFGRGGGISALGGGGRGKPTPGGRALRHVAGLWAEQGERDRAQARWEFEQRAIQGRWEVGEGRLQKQAALNQERAERAHRLKVFDGFRTLWENASKNSAERAHWKEMLGTYLGGLSPREREWLEPHMKGGPTDPEVIKEEFFDKKNPRIPPPRREEGETDPDYMARRAPWDKQDYVREWQKKRYMLGSEVVGPLQTLVPRGEDENGNTIFLRMPKDGPASYETRESSMYAKWEKTPYFGGKEKPPGTFKGSQGVERGKTELRDVGGQTFAYTQEYDHVRKKLLPMEVVPVGPSSLTREDLRLAIPKPAAGYPDFMVNWGQKPVDWDKDWTTAPNAGTRFYGSIYKFRKDQIKNQKDRSWEDLDKEVRRRLGRFWPGHTVRYKYEGEPSKDKPFGKNPQLEVIPGMVMYARDPGTEEEQKKTGKKKWIKIVWDSSSTMGALWGLNRDKDIYEPFMTRKEHLEYWDGDDIITVGEYRNLEGIEEGVMYGISR